MITNYAEVKYEKKLIFSLLVAALLVISLIGCAVKTEKKVANTLAIEKKGSGHPGSMEKLDCIECHKNDAQ